MAEECTGAQVEAALETLARRVEDCLSGCLRAPGVPDGLLEAMEYSLHAGGKRLRPALCLISARVCSTEAHSGEACSGGVSSGEDAERAVLLFACALECIHTYSLIHDDLPAMDDDDFRRGRPSNHKKFGEAPAILAGDGLLTDAFALMARCADAGLPAERVLRAVGAAAKAAGSAGMVGGQFLDMLYTGGVAVGIEELAVMQAMKTGAMLRLSCEAGALLSGAGPEKAAALACYGEALGAAFQIADDILDVTGDPVLLGKGVGKDAAARKCTYPALLGLERSRAEAERRAKEAVAALEGFSGESAALLKGLAAYVVGRAR
ncbi:MAG: polyprenyl synthetase family protein [Desulfovibrio sp.]|jgi:geranylgeranyl diphosphate synthase type II|nr:polyprenyl synthetase family protein [Desulfovibrio sp.]